MKTISNTAYYLQVVFLALVIGTGLQIAFAWTPPTSAPPSQSVAGPVTLGDAPQLKSGGLGVRSLVIIGKGQSSSTLGTDPGNTLATKDYIDNKIPLNCNTGIISDATGKMTCGAGPVIPPSKIAQKNLSVGGLSAPGSTDVAQYNSCVYRCVATSYPLQTIPTLTVKGPSSSHTSGTVIAANKTMTINMNGYVDHGLYVWVSINGGPFTVACVVQDPASGQHTVSQTCNYNLDLPADGYARFAHSAGPGYQNYYISTSVAMTFLGE